MWLLSGDDEQAIATSEQVRPGDLVLRRTADGLAVGRAQPSVSPPVDWHGELDGSLVPDEGLLADLDDRTPLQRIEDGDSPALHRAIEGLESAERNRGG